MDKMRMHICYVGYACYTHSVEFNEKNEVDCDEVQYHTQ